MENEEEETGVTEMVKQMLKWFIVGVAILELPFLIMILIVSEKALFIQGAIALFGLCLFLLFVILVFLFSRTPVRQT